MRVCLMSAGEESRRWRYKGKIKSRWQASRPEASQDAQRGAVSSCHSYRILLVLDGTSCCFQSRHAPRPLWSLHLEAWRHHTRVSAGSSSNPEKWRLRLSNMLRDQCYTLHARKHLDTDAGWASLHLRLHVVAAPTPSQDFEVLTFKDTFSDRFTKILTMYTLRAGMM